VFFSSEEGESPSNGSESEGESPNVFLLSGVEGVPPLSSPEYQTGEVGATIPQIDGDPRRRFKCLPNPVDKNEHPRMDLYHRCPPKHIV